ncbi:YitT family protein [Marixanthomonas sp. SCSIO 43207]|uniref:YitT family protein n=1 Tax=Marixanthomonas sp. SCSIO 43207 TaxID=2779360 RepID=UPI001CA7DEAB|nr:YitT family protein [Marixanthomonas sp. SCSIO 43207]UAB82480.1 YitT family protein [Marixanthomonas sp. SCSIO 43207]
MNPIIRNIIVESVKRRYRKDNTNNDEQLIQKKADNLVVEIKHEISDFIYLIIGVLSATLGLEGFLLPNSFIDGGVTGISLIVKELTGISLPILIFFINLPFLILGYFAISKRFAIKSVFGILFLSLSLYLIPIPSITEDGILIATFGGLFLGLGIGMAIRGGAIIDGTEVLAIYLSRKTNLTVGNVILIFNVLIFLTAAYFLSTEIALYAILTYFAASKTVDFVIDGIEEFMGVTIVSEKNEEIRQAIISKMGRGCTIYKAQNGFAKSGEQLKDTNVIYTVITRLEMSKLKTEIDKIDHEAFIIMASIKDAKGGMIKKKPLKKIK